MSLVVSLPVNYYTGQSLGPFECVHGFNNVHFSVVTFAKDVVFVPSLCCPSLSGVIQKKLQSRFSPNFMKELAWTKKEHITFLSV